VRKSPAATTTAPNDRQDSGLELYSDLEVLLLRRGEYGCDAGEDPSAPMRTRNAAISTMRNARALDITPPIPPDPSGPPSPG